MKPTYEQLAARIAHQREQIIETLQVNAAANARIAELEATLNEYTLAWSKCQGRLEAANARAVFGKTATQCDYPASWCAYPGCDKCAANHPRLPCTAAERKVLDACRDAYIYQGPSGRASLTDSLSERRICLAELANRASKAERGTPSLGHPGADEVFRDLQARHSRLPEPGESCTPAKRSGIGRKETT